MGDLAWLTARPVAHRGLHDRACGIIENTLTAVSAAIEAGYAAEVDLQVSADGEAMVHHDDALGRLTEGAGELRALSAAAIKAARFRDGGDRIHTLGELCDLVAGRITLVLELKSRFDADARLVERAAQVIASYTGPVAVMSFDPFQIEALRAVAPQIVRGIVAERHYRDEEWAPLTAAAKREMAYLLHGPRTRPHFLAYAVRDLPAPAPLVARHVFGRPLLTWTVRTQAERAVANRFADQMIFEGFRP
jgi:glycerophosphoryl diester phosphodiesterase